MTVHPFDRILTPDLSASPEDSPAPQRSYQVKLDRRQALAAIFAASGAALAGANAPLFSQEPDVLGRGGLPTFEGRGLYIVQSKFGDLWQRSTRERVNVLGPFVRGAEGAEAAEIVEGLAPDEASLEDGAPPPPPTADAGGADARAGGTARPSGYLAWLTEGEARDLTKELSVALVAPYVPAMKIVAPVEAGARQAAIVSLAPNAWEKTPPAETFLATEAVADELKKALATVAADVSVDVRDNFVAVTRDRGASLGDDALALMVAHPQVAAVEWEAMATTLALGEEGGDERTTMALGEEGGAGEAPAPTTQAVGEEGGVIDATTYALGEEGSTATTYALGEEGGGVTTYALGEEGGATTYALGEEGGVTTYALGEEGSGATTFALGEEGGGTNPTTLALGEEGGGVPTTRALGEEGGGIPQRPPVTTKALGEEGGGVPNKPPVTTQAFNEEGGGGPSTRALGEEGGGGVQPAPRPPANPSPRTTMALGEEGGGGGRIRPGGRRD